MLRHSFTRRFLTPSTLASTLSTLTPPLPSTHTTTNQAPPFSHNIYTSDPILTAAVASACPPSSPSHALLSSAGAYYGDAAHFSHAEDANAHPPTLQAYDAVGNRVNRASFHPSWSHIMSTGTHYGVGHGVWAATLPSSSSSTPSSPPPSSSYGAGWGVGKEWAEGRYTARGAALYLHTQWEMGSTCPLVMTNAAFPLLAAVGENATLPEGERRMAAKWADMIAGSTGFSLDDVPAGEKPGVTLGMSMTEKQGGSDVRANTTTASPIGGPDCPVLAGLGVSLSQDEMDAGPHGLVGHKWFTSAPMCDAFITLAYAEEGMTAFLIPRWLESGERNAGFQVMRLKNKLGDRSNASSEVEYRNAIGFRLGAPGKGIATLLEMVHHTRLDCVTGSAGSMRMGLTRAAHHARHRSVFGSVLADTPLGANVLADLALETTASTLMATELMHAFEGAAGGDVAAAAYARIATSVSKYYVCKRLPQVAAEAMEVFGGNGYTDDSNNGMPRLFRQSPLNSIWEGCGSVQALDLFRATSRHPEAMEMFISHIEDSLRGSTPQAASFLSSSPAISALRSNTLPPSQGRAAMHALALAIQAMLMVKHTPSHVADAFLASRLSSPSGVGLFGALDASPHQLQDIIHSLVPDPTI